MATSMGPSRQRLIEEYYSSFYSFPIGYEKYKYSLLQLHIPERSRTSTPYFPERKMSSRGVQYFPSLAQPTTTMDRMPTELLPHSKQRRSEGLGYLKGKPVKYFLSFSKTYLNLAVRS